MSGAQILLECLVRENVDCIFGYPGGVTLPLYDAFYDHPIRHVLVRHEQNAAFAAEGYARSTGRVGVCCATSGPGATNLVTGLVDSMMDSIPVVALTGQVSTKLIGSDAFQEADTFGITRSCTKHNFLVKNVAELPQVIHEAFYIASSGRPGPGAGGHSQGRLSGPIALHAGFRRFICPATRSSPKDTPGQIRRAAQMMWEAQRPFVYAGGGIIAANASDELRELVELLDAPDREHADGPGRAARRASQFRQHAGHARQLRRQHGHEQYRSSDRAGRALRRPRHGPSGGLRAARQSDSRRHRSGRDRQEPRPPTCPSSATSSACCKN